MKGHVFTLVEVLIALAVLTFGVLAATGLVTSAQRRIAVARGEWLEQHLMSQAAEYFLLAEPEAALPDFVFPARGYRVTAEHTAAELPEQVPDNLEGWRLLTLRLILYDADGAAVRELRVNRIVGGPL